MIPSEHLNEHTVTDKPERERRPSCECPQCLYSADCPEDAPGEARLWVIHDAALLRDHDDALDMLAELDRIDEHLDAVERYSREE